MTIKAALGTKMEFIIFPSKEEGMNLSVFDRIVLKMSKTHTIML